LAEKKAAIGFSYDETPATPFEPTKFKKPNDEDEDSDFDEGDLGVSLEWRTQC
jgi:hypothetical protein